MFCLSLFLSPQIAQIHTDFNFPDRRIKRQIRTIRSEKQASPHRAVAHQFQLYLISHLCNAVMNALPETPCNIILGRFLARIRKYFLRIIIFHHIAHIEEERKQRLIDHLDGTAKLAGKFAESFGKYEWGYCIGMLHDLGKYSKEFQHKIQFNTNDRVDHSTAGMRLCNEKGGYYSILQYAIAGHHSGLMDYYKLEERYRKSICDYQAYRQEVEIPQIKNIDISISHCKEYAVATVVAVVED